MKPVLASCLAACALAIVTSPAESGTPAHPEKAVRPRFTTEATPIGALLDNAAARAIVDRHIPDFSTDSRIKLARTFTLKGLQRFAMGRISDKQLAAIDTDFAKMRR